MCHNGTVHGARGVRISRGRVCSQQSVIMEEILGFHGRTRDTQ